MAIFGRIVDRLEAVASWAKYLGVLDVQSQVGTHLDRDDVIDDLGRRETTVDVEADLAEVGVQFPAELRYLSPGVVIAALGCRASAVVGDPTAEAFVRVAVAASAGDAAAGVAAGCFHGARHGEHPYDGAMKRPQLTLRDLFWLTVVLALGIGWWLEYRRHGEVERKDQAKTRFLKDSLAFSERQLAEAEDLLEFEGVVFGGGTTIHTTPEGARSIRENRKRAANR
jgi:hypothetical protein